jgi:hypothetical protein
MDSRLSEHFIFAAGKSLNAANFSQCFSKPILFWISSSNRERCMPTSGSPFFPEVLLAGKFQHFVKGPV